MFSNHPESSLNVITLLIRLIFVTIFVHYVNEYSLRLNKLLAETFRIFFVLFSFSSLFFKPFLQSLYIAGPFLCPLSESLLHCVFLIPSILPHAG